MIGSCGLRIISPTMLELTLVNTKSPEPARVIQWDFVGENFVLQPARRPTTSACWLTAR